MNQGGMKGEGELTSPQANGGSRPEAFIERGEGAGQQPPLSPPKEASSSFVTFRKDVSSLLRRDPMVGSQLASRCVARGFGRPLWEDRHSAARCGGGG